MIGYIRHDEEFNGVVKLTTGQEIIGKMIATEEDGRTLIFVQDPAEAKVHDIKNQSSNNRIVKGLSFTKWFPLSDEDFFIIPEESIVSVASMSNEISSYYVAWVRDMNPNKESNNLQVELTEDFGKITSIQEAKQKLEKIFKYL